MEKKLFLSDFDGTIVKEDILDIVCGLTGKSEESQTINASFIEGKNDKLVSLKKRIDFLKGLRIEAIHALLREDRHLMKGCVELFSFLRQNNFITVLHSGNIVPVLQFYQDYLNIDFIIGTSPRICDGIIQGIELADLKDRNFKMNRCKEIIDKYKIDKNNIVAIGDSPADIGVFELAGTSIAINPKPGIEMFVDFTVSDGDLNKIIPIINTLFVSP